MCIKRKSAASARPVSAPTGFSEVPQKRTAPKIVAAVVIAAVVIVLWVAKGVVEAQSEPENPVTSDTTATQVSASSTSSSDVWALDAKSVDIEAIAEANVPAVIDFGSDSCIPCKEMAPVLKKTNADMRGRAIVKFVDVWKYTDAANGFPIQVIPTQVLIMPGGEPYVPREGLFAEFGLEFAEYEDASGQHTFTTHQGALTQEQMDAILEDMGA